MALKAYTDKLDKIVYYMLLFTVAVIPLNQAFTAFCVSITFICALIGSWHKRKRKILKKWQQGLLYLLLVIGWLSLHLSADKFASSFNFLYVVGQYAALIFVLLRYGWLRPNSFLVLPPVRNWRERFLRLPRPLQLIGAFLTVSVAVSIIGILQKIFGAAVEGVWVDPNTFPELKIRVYSTLVNPNILAGYLVLVISYVAAFFSVFKNRRLRLWLVITGLLAACCLLFTYSRGNWLACGAMLVVFCMLFYHKAFVPVALVTACALYFGGDAVWHRLISVLNSQDTSMALRVAYFRSTNWIIEANPLGVGWYGYQFIYPTYNYYLADTSVIMYHCHNLFLNVLAELGWHGLFAFLAVWGMFFCYAWKLAFNRKGVWTTAVGRGYVLATVGIAVGGLTDHVYFNTQMGLLFWLMGILVMLTNYLDKYEVKR